MKGLRRIRLHSCAVAQPVTPACGMCGLTEEIERVGANTAPALTPIGVRSTMSSLAMIRTR